MPFDLVVIFVKNVMIGWCLRFFEDNVAAALVIIQHNHDMEENDMESIFPFKCRIIKKEHIKTVDLKMAAIICSA